MKLTLYDWEEDYDRYNILYIDGREHITIGPVEPEDAIIGRDLIDGGDIINYIELGFKVAQRGEQIEYEYINNAPEGW